MKWFIVCVTPGQEEKAEQLLKKKLENLDLSNTVGEFFIPKERVLEVKNARKKTSKKKMFPGYLFTQVDLVNEDGDINMPVYTLFQNTKYVRGFLGGSNPSEVQEEEIADIKGKGKEKAKFKEKFDQGDEVAVKEGAFQGFVGNIIDLKINQGKIIVEIDMFGTKTPITVSPNQLELVS